MGSGYCARDSSENSRHSVQVVHATGVVGLKVFGQEWLHEEKDGTHQSVELQNCLSYVPPFLSGCCVGDACDQVTLIFFFRNFRAGC